MANINAPYGLQAVELQEQNMHMYYKSAAVIVAVGDRVIRVANSTDPRGYGMVTRAATGGAMTGVVVAILPSVNRILSLQKYLGAADTGYVIVADHPLQEFMIRDNGGATDITIADMGNGINTVAAIDANTLTGRSKDALDTQAKASGNSFILVRKAEKVGNELGKYCEWIIRPNLHTEVNASAANLTEI